MTNNECINSRKSKKRLRIEALAQREALTEKEWEARCQQVNLRLTQHPLWLESEHIALYSSVNKEIHTRPLLEKGWQQGKKIYLPKCIPEKNELHFYLVQTFDDLSGRYYGIPEPNPETCLPLQKEELELVVTPGLLFDREGYRIGYGGGYYDRFLRALPPDIKKISLAFSFQLSKVSLPREEFDVPVDCLFTEEEVIRCSSEDIFTSVVLAGGQSRRMGTSKARLSPFGHKTVLEYAIDTAEAFSDQVVVVTNHEDRPFFEKKLSYKQNVTLVTDDPHFKGEGPLAGMYTGMKQGEATWYFVLACDLVQLDKEYVTGLKRFVHQGSFNAHYDAFIPQDEEHHHPLAAVYTHCPEKIAQLLKQGKRKLGDLQDSLHVCLITKNQWQNWTELKHPFYNMNRPEEYTKWLEVLKEDGQSWLK